MTVSNLLAQAYDNQLSQLMDLDRSFVAAMSGAVSSQAGYTPTGQASPSNAPAVVSVGTGQFRIECKGAAVCIEAGTADGSRGSECKCYYSDIGK